MSCGYQEALTKLLWPISCSVLEPRENQSVSIAVLSKLKFWCISTIPRCWCRECFEVVFEEWGSGERTRGRRDHGSASATAVCEELTLWELEFSWYWRWRGPLQCYICLFPLALWKLKGYLMRRSSKVHRTVHLVEGIQSKAGASRAQGLGKTDTRRPLQNIQVQALSFRSSPARAWPEERMPLIFYRIIWSILVGAELIWDIFHCQ